MHTNNLLANFLLVFVFSCFFLSFFFSLLVSLFLTSLRDWRVSCAASPRWGEFRLCAACEPWALCGHFRQARESADRRERKREREQSESSAWQHFHHGPCDWRFVGAWRVFLALRVERYVKWEQWYENSLIAGNFGLLNRGTYAYGQLCLGKRKLRLRNCSLLCEKCGYSTYK